MRRFLIGLAVVAVVLGVWVGVFLMVNKNAVAQSSDVVTDASASDTIAGETLDILNWNLGYAGLGAGSDFVADGGTHMFPPSQQAVRDNVAGIEALLRARQDDVFVFQEMAHDGPVNYWVNLKGHVDEALAGRNRVFFADFKTRLMPWPLRMEHGQAIYSRFALDGGDVVPLPAEDSGIFGVRRRYASVVARMPMQNGAGWTIASVHLAAFDDDAAVRTRQLHEVLAWAQREYESGRHVVLAGDWNLQLVETNFPHNTDQRFLFWLFPFPHEALPGGWRIAADASIPSVRTNHKPYVAGENYVTTIDGYIVSPNVTVEAVNGLDLGFEHTDHQPVHLRVRAITPGAAP